MYISEGNWEADCSDLRVEVHKVHYRGPEYVKLKASLYNKLNGIWYETKNYKLYYKNIEHWKKVFDTD